MSVDMQALLAAQKKHGGVIEGKDNINEEYFMRLWVFSRVSHLILMETNDNNKELTLKFIKDFSDFGINSNYPFPNVEFIVTDNPEDISGVIEFHEVNGGTCYSRKKPKYYSESPTLFVIDATKPMPQVILNEVIRMSEISSFGEGKLPEGVGYLILTQKVKELATYIKSMSGCTELRIFNFGLI